MGWVNTYIVYRLNPEGKLEEVFNTSDLKKANYWLSYIAQPGDFLCRTPIHPKHTQKTKFAEYMRHKESSGTAVSAEEKWKTMATDKKFNFVFPESQLNTSQS